MTLMQKPVEKLFAVTAPGLAPFVARELQQLDLLPAIPQARPSALDPKPRPADDMHGGVEFSGALRALYRANLHLRTANRVLLRLGDFPAVGFTELRRRAARLPWERLLAPGQPVALRVTCHKSRLYHSDAVAERVAGAIADRLGKPPVIRKFDEQAAGQPPQLVVVRLVHDHCTISVDSSGELLHRRGYRLATAKAPLRETLAAGMLLAADWDPLAGAGPAPLLDPFCGSGTIPIEAALLARGIAPGVNRRFAFMDWPDFDADLWKTLLAEAEERRSSQTAMLGGRLEILASDRDNGAIEMAQTNAARAGVADTIEFSCRAFSAVTPPAEPGWLVTNPPYGLRVAANRDLRNLYAQFGNVLRASFAGWRVAILGNDRQLLGQLRLPLDTSLALVNGGIAVVLARGSIGA
jgi:putative N6-adenine-specific DNA methylase